MTTLLLLVESGSVLAERNKPIGSNVENFIRGANCTIMTVGENFKPPTRFIFAYEYSPTCVNLMKRIAQSDLLRLYSVMCSMSGIIQKY